jgi:hypothetical protein
MKATLLIIALLLQVQLYAQEPGSKISNDNTIQSTGLISFSAKAEAMAIAISWETASEVSNDHFTIEKSTDGYTFTPITDVTGAGNSAFTHSYSYTDKDPFNGTSYYRLKVVDDHGSCMYSNTIAAQWTAPAQSPVVYPNPCLRSQQLTITNTLDGPARIEIRGAMGRPIFSMALEKEQSIVIDKTLDPGCYMVIITTGSRSQAQRLIIQ